MSDTTEMLDGTLDANDPEREGAKDLPTIRGQIDKIESILREATISEEYFTYEGADEIITIMEAVIDEHIKNNNNTMRNYDFKILIRRALKSLKGEEVI